MSTSVDQAFIKNFEAEIYAQFRQMGSVLRNTVCIKNDVIGASTTFQKVGHDPVECVLLDYYAGDWIDQFDEIKTNINEWHVATRACAYMLGRKINDMIIRQLQTSQVFAGSDSDALTKERSLMSNKMVPPPTSSRTDQTTLDHDFVAL